MKGLRSPAHRALTRALIQARTDAGLTQEQLAKKLHRHQSFVAKYETGERRLEVIEFTQICRALTITPGDLLDELPSTASD